MASISKVGSKYKVEVAVKGRRASKRLPSMKAAKIWAAEKELEFASMAKGGGRAATNLTFGSALRRYKEEVTAKRRTERGAEKEGLRIEAFLRDQKLANVPLNELDAGDFRAWRDRRLEQVKPSSVVREMNTLSSVCSHAVKEWEWLEYNPLSKVTRPKESKPRTRRPTSEEIEQVLFICGYSPDAKLKSVGSRVGAAFLFAIETAMRLGEIAQMEWSMIKGEGTYADLPGEITKTGLPRVVPLSATARHIIKQLQIVAGDDDFVFKSTPVKLSANYYRIMGKFSTIEDLHFHDTRREALTRLSKKYDVMELAKISGHLDLRTLQNVYYAPSPEDLVAKIDG